MNKNLKNVMALLMMQVCLVLCMPVSAQIKSKPRWVQKGEESMDRQRSNESYRFKVFNTYDQDVNKLKAERFDPLLTYVRETYQADLESMRLDSLRVDDDMPTTYLVSFSGEAGEESVVYAQLVDEHCSYEDYVDGTFQFEYYQLYAISERDSIPEFDEFELTRTYNAQAVCMSLIPGMGQIYKGQKAKGYVILGAEAALVAGTVYSSIKMHYCNQMAKKEFPDSWKSKARSWRNMRNINIGLAGGLYIYNLIDAAVSEGARQVVVRKPDGRQVSVTPVAAPDAVGVSVAFRF